MQRHVQRNRQTSEGGRAWVILRPRIRHTLCRRLSRLWRSDRELVWLVEAEHPTLREAVDTVIKAERAAAAAAKKKYDH